MRENTHEKLTDSVVALIVVILVLVVVFGLELRWIDYAMKKQF